MRPRRFIEWAPLAIALGALALWELLVRASVLPALFFPAPSVILITTARLALSGDLAANTLVTVSRVVSGLLLGGASGLLLGVAMGWSSRLRRVIDPFVAAFHPLPKIAVLPLIMVIFGVGGFSRMLVVAIAVFFPMVISSMAGVRQIEPVYLEVAESYGAGPSKLLSRIVLPASLPTILAGARIAANLGLSITIALELLLARDGLGAMIWDAWQTLRVEELFASLIAVGILGLCFRLGLDFLFHRLVPWHGEREPMHPEVVN